MVEGGRRLCWSHEMTGRIGCRQRRPRTSGALVSYRRILTAFCVGFSFFGMGGLASLKARLLRSKIRSNYRYILVLYLDMQIKFLS